MKTSSLFLGICLAALATSHAFADSPATRNLAILKAPPPRATDVIAQVRQAPDFMSEVEEKRKRAASEPPPGATPEEMVDFLIRRAAAAEDIGDIARRLADLRRIADLSRGARNEAAMFYNLGLAETLYGDLRQGLAAFRHVLSLLEANNTNWGLEIQSHAIVAIVHIYAGQLEEAEVSVGKAKYLLDRAKQRPGGWAGFIPSWEALTMAAQGRLLAARGRWTEAEASFRLAHGRMEESARNLDKLVGQSRNLAMQSNQLAGRNLMAGFLAEQLVRQGKADEAELLLRDMLAVNLERAGRYSVRTAIVLNQLADILNARGRHRDALEVLRVVDEIRTALGMQRLNQITLTMATTRNNTLFGMEDWAAGIAADDALRERLREFGWPGLASFTPAHAVGLVRVGRGSEALSRINAQLALLAKATEGEHPDRAALRGTRGMALVATGRRSEALAEFAAAFPALIAAAAYEDDVQSRSVNAIVRRHILEAYLQALADSRDQPDAAERAFRVADALHLGKTQQALAQSAARAAADQSGLADLIRAEQDSQGEQLALYAQLLRLAGMPPDQQLPKVMAEMRQRLRTLERERSERTANIERRFPAYANLIHPKPPTLAEARGVLKPGEALISLFSTETATFGWAFRASGEVAFAQMPLGRTAIAQAVAHVRQAVDPGAVDIARGLPAFDLGAAHELYSRLLEPVSGGWKGAESLLIVTNGALSQLPPALLPTAAIQLGTEVGSRYSAYRNIPWLIREAAVTQLPSVNSLVTLRRLPAGNPQRNAFLGFGDPDFAGTGTRQAATRRLRNLAIARINGQAPTDTPLQWAPYGDLPPLPDTREEILALAEVLKADKKRDVFLGRDASKAQVKKIDLARSRVVAFATHGLLPGEFAGVDQPSIALANPGDGQHGLLTLDEILGLKLDADWVILSACNTAAGDGSGAEAISGLGRGFFYAGTRSLLATHWPVESVSARLLVSATFANQAKDPSLSRAQALRQSMLDLMTQTSADGFSYAHPLFWAPYALFGDGGR